jgi:predicted ATP-grasp superfamily ATP-dependent carboligase
VEKRAAIPSSTPQKGVTVSAHQPREVGAVVLGGDFQGLGILRSLGSRNVPTYLLDQGLCISRFSRYARRFTRCPDVKHDNLFLDFLIDLARKESLWGWIIYPNDDETVCFLAKHKEQLEGYYRISTPSWDVTKFAHEKKLTYQLAEKSGIAVPKTFYPRGLKELEQLDLVFPVIIKPSVKEPFYSQTRKKAIRADSRSELMEEFTKVSSIVNNAELMIQELVPGGTTCLFSVGSLFKNGEFCGKVVARRSRQHPMDFGHATTYAETVDIPELEGNAKKILGAMGYYGLSEVEFMMDSRDGEYKLIEINARAWGWHTLAIGAGVDLPYLLYQDMLGEKVQQDSFDKDAKWIRLVTDIPTAVGEIFKGRMEFTSYLNSLMGKKHFAVLSITDPLPFIAELLMLPSLWKKRGF